MKISSICLLRYSGDTPESVILDGAFNLAEHGYFQRGTVRDFLAFGSRLLHKRVGPGMFKIDYEGNMAFCYVLGNGLGAIAFCDVEYPDRVAMSMLRKLLGEFQAAWGEKWKGVLLDYGAKFPALEEAIVAYQDPAQVDKLMKLDKQLLETKEVLHKTMEVVLARGEKLDDLIAKSDQLSQQSKLFYKQAKKTNSCCEIM